MTDTQQHQCYFSIRCHFVKSRNTTKTSENNYQRTRAVIMMSVTAND